MIGGFLLGKTKMIYVHGDFVEDALEARYNDVKDLWGNQASHALWPQALELLLDSGELHNTPSFYVDNYLVNGDFVEREENQTDEEWETYCQNHALTHSDKYACLNF